MNPNIAGGKRGIQRFASKNGLTTNYSFEPGDVAQVIRRGSPLFQTLVIVQRANGEDVDAFLVNADGSRTVHRLSAHELSIVGKAPYGEKEGVFIVGSMTKIPKLERAAKNAGMPLVNIEFSRPGDMRQGVQFTYEYSDDGQRKTMSRWQDDFETGVEKEIAYMQSEMATV